MAKQPGACGRPRSLSHLRRFAELTVVQSCKRISPARAKLWAVIHGFTSREGCYLGAAALADRAGMTVKGVYSALEWLEKWSLIRVVSRGPGRSSSRYTILPPACQPENRKDVRLSVQVLTGFLPPRNQKGPSPRGSRESTAGAVGYKRERREKVTKTFSLYRSNGVTEQAVSPEGERLAPDYEATRQSVRAAAGLPSDAHLSHAERVKQQLRRAAARAREARGS